jgi:hypothetical protein
MEVRARGLPNGSISVASPVQFAFGKIKAEKPRPGRYTAKIPVGREEKKRAIRLPLH